MSRIHASVRVALAVSLLALIVLCAGAATAGYLVESASQRTQLARSLADAAAYVGRGAPDVQETAWQQGLTRKLTALHLRAQVTIVAPSKMGVYESSGLSLTSPPAQPTASYVFHLEGVALQLDLFAPPTTSSRPLLAALAAGLAALLAGGTLLMWVATRWLVVPLRRLTTQVDAIAGGDPIQSPARSPIREVSYVAQAIAGMGTTLAQAAEHDARLEAERRLLVSSIAHDLRTPLFSLRGYLDAIASGIGDPGERLERAQAKAEQIGRLVAGLFDYARADFGQQPSLRMTDLATAVTGTIAGFDLAAQERAVKLDVTAHPGHLVRIDHDSFERALANVIDNALRHTQAGGTISVTCGEEAGQAFVRVIDDGPGIPPDLLPDVFEPMVRAGPDAAGGAGLGLTIAARLLQDQDGTIEAANAPARGACLTLRLPRTAPVRPSS